LKRVSTDGSKLERNVANKNITEKEGMGSQLNVVLTKA